MTEKEVKLTDIYALFRSTPFGCLQEKIFEGSKKIKADVPEQIVIEGKYYTLKGIERIIRTDKKTSLSIGYEEKKM